MVYPRMNGWKTKAVLVYILLLAAIETRGTYIYNCHCQLITHHIRCFNHFPCKLILTVLNAPGHHYWLNVYRILLQEGPRVKLAFPGICMVLNYWLVQLSNAMKELDCSIYSVILIWEACIICSELSSISYSNEQKRSWESQHAMKFLQGSWHSRWL